MRKANLDLSLRRQGDPRHPRLRTSCSSLYLSTPHPTSSDGASGNPASPPSHHRASPVLGKHGHESLFDDGEPPKLRHGVASLRLGREGDVAERHPGELEPARQHPEHPPSRRAVVSRPFLELLLSRVPRPRPGHPDADGPDLFETGRGGRAHGRPGLLPPSLPQFLHRGTVPGAARRRFPFERLPQRVVVLPRPLLGREEGVGIAQELCEGDVRRLRPARPEGFPPEGFLRSTGWFRLGRRHGDLEAPLELDKLPLRPRPRIRIGVQLERALPEGGFDPLFRGVGGRGEPQHFLGRDQGGRGGADRKVRRGGGQDEPPGPDR
mmetsp:Transcript_41332/g.80932  ORF Transcript_41332/g.80932 Transcript_41332/m.80932 type:complete len:323 (-) Transcript_41332:121-1089(-)